MWAPDGRHVITAAEFQLRLTIWSLVSSSVLYIKFPKFGTPQGLAFSHDGSFAAVLERSEGRDFVSVFKCDTWDLIRHFPASTADAVALAWSPDDRYITLVDSPMDHKVSVYVPTGQLAGEYSGYENALGIKVRPRPFGFCLYFFYKKKQQKNPHRSPRHLHGRPRRNFWPWAATMERFTC
jgi:hypothetical protein